MCEIAVVSQRTQTLQQAVDVLNDAFLPNPLAYGAGERVAHTDADLYDVQRVAVPGGCGRRRLRVLSIWMEEVMFRRCHRTLSLMNSSTPPHTFY